MMEVIRLPQVKVGICDGVKDGERCFGRRLEVGTKGRHAKLHTRRATILTAAEPQRRVHTRWTWR
jgi:hypothetical protein